MTLNLDQLLSSQFPQIEGDDKAPEDEESSKKAMYSPYKPRQIDSHNEGVREMLIEVTKSSEVPLTLHQEEMVLAGSSGEGFEVKAPKKLGETWVHEETQCLLSLRRETDNLFNISKSNKHLWEQISDKMRDRGFDRSPTMCTDKWWNLLKEINNVKHRFKVSGALKMSYYKEIDGLLRDRIKHAVNKSPTSPKVDSYLQFSERGPVEDGIPFGSSEVGDNHTTYCGRVITVKRGACIKKIGIDGTAEAIKEAIKSAFGLRTKRAFWLEDEDEVVRSLDRDMPLRNYMLHLDEGVMIRIFVCDDADGMTVRTEDKTFYAEDDFYEFLTRHRWYGLRELSSFRSIETFSDLRPGIIYQGVAL